ncbi:3-ketosteroid 9alpha-monooxygenase subunit B [Saccharopolyspora antimicrobica]|uniref:3-ketosteroid 9alpha-monooxygenase subunit B n=1 Tax=Saccharopolyspora antimicrobica TaxID=455193 RepID=A0A1I5J412_9PSEU|nr:ferredoxin--NADP reductase [Saccharopolyspora antimicrobica]RKT82012.1 3-ketosteroid 9alpha-monooxygenase subunit B [Saccharopolyspora antimicrobica]SFO67568.1 3-ketosteroid 9alpha-monooxygenase subunit B [Saccharopolyspora antimicrobica]
MPEPARLRVVAVVEETSESRSLVFEAPEGWSYRPGQFLTLRIPSDRTGSVARSYSLSSSPHVDDALQVTVKRAGYGSNWLCDNVTAGSEVDVLPPSGAFVPGSLDADVLLLAAGSGITPVMSIAKSVLAAGTGRIALIYANQHQDAVIFDAELRELVARHPERLLVVHWLESVQGLPTAPALRELARPFADRECFVCGPGGFMDTAEEALRELEIPRARTHIERFVSLKRNPFERKKRTEQIAPEETTAAGGDATVELDLDGKHHKLRWPRQQRLLDVLLDNGVAAPFSCREGACSACACRIDRGEVKMLQNSVLEQEDLDEGIILACQSLPITDEIHISYE